MQKLQNLLFPSGIYFDKNTDDYRTETENEVFKTFRMFSNTCKIGKEKVTTEYLRLSPLVGIADEISNIKFIEDFDRIVNFIHSEIDIK